MNLQRWWNERPRPGWHREAACRGMPTASFFKAYSNLGKTVCVRCPVSDDCLVDALRFELGDSRKRVGIYGGMMAWQRQTFWRALVDAGLHLFDGPKR